MVRPAPAPTSRLAEAGTARRSPAVEAEGPAHLARSVAAPSYPGPVIGAGMICGIALGRPPCDQSRRAPVGKTADRRPARRFWWRPYTTLYPPWIDEERPGGTPGGLAGGTPALRTRVKRGIEPARAHCARAFSANEKETSPLQQIFLMTILLKLKAAHRPTSTRPVRPQRARSAEKRSRTSPRSPANRFFFFTRYAQRPVVAYLVEKRQTLHALYYLCA